MSDRRCSACGKNLERLPEEVNHQDGWVTRVDGLTDALIGMCMTLELPSSMVTVQDRAYFWRQMGAYKPNITYNICWECMLKAYGVQPDVCSEKSEKEA